MNIQYGLVAMNMTVCFVDIARIGKNHGIHHRPVFRQPVQQSGPAMPPPMPIASSILMIFE